VFLTFVPCRTPQNNSAQPEKVPPTKTSAGQNTNRQSVVYGYYSSSAIRQTRISPTFGRAGFGFFHGNSTFLCNYSTLSCGTQLRFADTTLRTASRAWQSRQKLVAADLFACTAACSHGSQWCPLGLMTTFRLLAIGGPPPTHTMWSLLKGRGLASNLAVLRTPQALKSAYNNIY
jgi:hypothetical protein